MRDKDWSLGDMTRVMRWHLAHSGSMRSGITSQRLLGVGCSEGRADEGEHPVQTPRVKKFLGFLSQIQRHAPFLYPQLKAGMGITLARGVASSDAYCGADRALALQLAFLPQRSESPVLFRILSEPVNGVKSERGGCPKPTETLAESADLEEVAIALAQHWPLDPENVDAFRTDQNPLPCSEGEFPLLQQDAVLRSLRTPGTVFFHELPAPVLSRQREIDGGCHYDWDLSDTTPMDDMVSLSHAASCLPIIFMPDEQKRSALHDYHQVSRFLKQAAHFYQADGLKWPTRVESFQSPDGALRRFRQNVQLLAQAVLDKEFPGEKNRGCHVNLIVQARATTVKTDAAITAHEQFLYSGVEISGPGGQPMRSRPLLAWRQALQDDALLETRSVLPEVFEPTLRSQAYIQSRPAWFHLCQKWA
jgi:hypothetical protein